MSAQGHSVPSLANSYSKDYDPDDWLRVDRATGQIQTQRVLSPASPFLKDGWYRAIILAYDDGECQAVPGLRGSRTRAGHPCCCPRTESCACRGADSWVGSLPQQGKEPTRPLPPAASPPSTATGTLSIEILEVNDHAPELSPPSGSVCSKPDQGSGLLLGATDADLPPHGAPFHFQLSPRVPELTRNWSVSRVNGEFFQTPARGCSPETWGTLSTVVLLVPAASSGGAGTVTPSGRMGKLRPQVLGSSANRTLLQAARGAEGPWRGRVRARRVGRPLLTLGALCSEPRAPAAPAPGPGGSTPPQPAAPRLRAATPAARAAPERDGVSLRPGWRLSAGGRCPEGRRRGRQPGRPGHRAGQHHPPAL